MKDDESKQQLEKLQARENELRTLRDRERDLEVERIEAETALRRVAAKAPSNLDPGLASEIARALDRKLTLTDTLADLDQRLAGTHARSPKELERLKAGHRALVEWLEAPQVREPKRFQAVVQLILLVLTLAAIWAAIAIHPALLLVLLVVVGPISFLTWRGQDTEWRRLGAKRHFEFTGLKVPTSWDEAAVKSRADELEATVESASQDAEHPPASSDALLEERATVAAELAEQEDQLAVAMAEAGLDPENLDDDTAQWLGLLARADRARRNLGQFESKRKSVSADADEIRDQLFWQLSREGEAPEKGRADADAIAEGFERLATKTRKDDEK